MSHALAKGAYCLNGYTKGAGYGYGSRTPKYKFQQCRIRTIIAVSLDFGIMSMAAVPVDSLYKKWCLRQACTNSPTNC